MPRIKARNTPLVNRPAPLLAAVSAVRKPTNNTAAFRLRMANKALVKSWERELEPLGLAEAHYYYMRVLLEEDGITQAELSERVSTEPPAVTGVLDKMSELGLVRRVADKTDRRKRRIFLTPKGAALRTPLLEAMEKRNETLLNGIDPDELEIFCRVLDKIVRNSDESMRAAWADAASGR